MSRPFLSHHERSAALSTLSVALGAALGVGCFLLFLSLVSHDGEDASRFYATRENESNALGPGGADVSGDLFAWLGYGAFALLAILCAWSAWLLIGRRRPRDAWARVIIGPLAVLAACAFLSAHGGGLASGWGYGGILGDRSFAVFVDLLTVGSVQMRLVVGTLMLAAATFFGLLFALGGRFGHLRFAFGRMLDSVKTIVQLLLGERASPQIYESSEGAYPVRQSAPPRAPASTMEWRRQRAREEPEAPYLPEHAPRPAPPAPEEENADAAETPSIAARLTFAARLSPRADAARQRAKRSSVPPAPESRRIEPSFSEDPRQIGDGAPYEFFEEPPHTVASLRAEPSAQTEPARPGAAWPVRAGGLSDISEESALDAAWRDAIREADAQNEAEDRRAAAEDPWSAFSPTPRRDDDSAAHRRPRRPTIACASPGYEPPPLDLLDPGPHAAPAPDMERRLANKAERLQRVLNEYGVRGDVIDVSPGPVVSQFELEPGPGVKVSRVVGLADDIARAMSSVSARVAPIPGKNVIGVELPNAERETVALRTLLEDSKFITHPGALPIALGVDLIGRPLTVDLARAPHLLIAGATGSGKSVAVNAILLSLLYRLAPSELRLLLIDPKMLELSVYNGAPHLLSPVVTDAREAVSALKWAVREMERRYELMSKLGVRGLDGYNARAEKLRSAGALFEVEAQDGVDPETGEPIVDIERMTPDPMARIVIIIDEMADLMMVAGKEIEHCVLRLAQMGRASGIHLVAATQRPSVDVITGLIKANFPTRISLQTASVADSKTILDRPGAERLLGKGDMLYAPGGGRLDRVQCAFVSDDEVADVADHLRDQGPAEDQVSFDLAQERGTDGAFGDADDGGDDAFYERAKRIVCAERRASASFLQRRLAIGYNRASRLIEQMERDGVVSPLTSSGKREVLGPQDAA